MKLLGILAICLAASLWGLDGVVLTPHLFGIPITFAVFLLHIIPFLIMQPFLWRSMYRVRAMTRRDWLVLFLVAFTGGFFGTFAMVKALFMVNFNHLSIVVLLQKLQPIWTISLAAVLLKEKFNRAFVSLALIALIGAYLLTFGLDQPDFSGSTSLVLAGFWSLIASFCFGAATVFGKMLLSTFDFKSATYVRYGMTSAITLIFLILSGLGLPFSVVSFTQWGLVLLIGLTTGSGAIFLYYFGLKYVKASVAAISELCLPLTAFVLDWLINDTILDPAQWCGAALLITAITSVSFLNRARSEPS
ncbi:DMT family transporter [bacterium]|nr:DMT family transporter [bacterium]